MCMYVYICIYEQTVFESGENLVLYHKNHIIVIIFPLHFTK